jgi:pectate lyase
MVRSQVPLAALLVGAALPWAACLEGPKRPPNARRPAPSEPAKKRPPPADPGRRGDMPAPPREGLAAFPGAEGFGATTTGGRGGRVIAVTTTADAGPGSLRAALKEKGPRIVVFRVSGVIENEKPLDVEEPFVTIAGQTAPGDGITLAGEELRIQTHDVVVRHLRVRTGDQRKPRDGWDNRDVINFGHPERRGETHDVVLDHCSLSWAVDETLTIWFGSHDITVQHCLLAEPLFRSRHPEGPHSMGILIGEGAANVSLHHNLLANSNGRNPQVAGAGVVDFRNNVVYNWGEYAALFKGPGNRINFVANYYKKGPDSERAWTKTAIKVRENARDLELHVAGNVDPVLPSPGADNWPMVVWWNGQAMKDQKLRAAGELPHPPVTTHSAAEAYELVLAGAGATRPRRDPVDRRVVEGVRGGTGRIIDSTKDAGGWPEMRSAPAPADSDQDGMPDDWEKAHGLDPKSGADGSQDQDRDGWTNVEEYLNELADSPPHQGAGS